MASPFPLVYKEDGQYKLRDEGLALISCEDGPLSVVAITGKYRTGKSFLINHGILGSPPGKKSFKVGHTVNACTKGITAFILRDPACLVLDTEGTASSEAGIQSDGELMGIALALSSMFVHNAVGPIDEEAIANLAVVAAAAESIMGDLGDETDDRPIFVWAMRDCHLTLETSAGKALTGTAYLDQQLHLDNSEVRARILKAFPQRKCFALVRPTLDEGSLQAAVAYKNLRPEFVDSLTEFRDYVCAAPPKRLRGTSLSGRALVSLATSLIAAANEGRVPRIADAWTGVVATLQREAEDWARAAAGRLKTALETELPMPPDTLRQLLEEKISIAESDVAQRYTLVGRERCAEVVRCSWASEIEHAFVRNKEKATQWTRNELKKARGKESPQWFRDHLAESAKKIGTDLACSLAPLCMEFLSEALIAQKDRCANRAEELEHKVIELQTELAAMSVLGEEATALRSRLDHALWEHTAREECLLAETAAAAERENTEAEALREIEQRMRDVESEESAEREGQRETPPLHELAEAWSAAAGAEATSAQMVSDCNELRAEMQERNDREKRTGERYAHAIEEIRAHSFEEFRTSEMTAMRNRTEEECKSETAILNMRAEYEVHLQKLALAQSEGRKEFAAELRSTRDACSSKLSERADAVRQIQTEAARGATEARTEKKRLTDALSEADCNYRAAKRRVSDIENTEKELTGQRAELVIARRALSEKEGECKALQTICDEQRQRIQRIELRCADHEEAIKDELRQNVYKIARLEIELESAKALRSREL